MYKSAARHYQSPALIEDVPVVNLPSVKDLFQLVLDQVNRPKQSIVTYLNVHVANTAYENTELKRFLKQADFVYCDGAGIQVGAKILGQPEIDIRLPAADWFIDFFRFMAESGKTVYLLGGQPGVSSRMQAVLDEQVSEHTLVGHHHGYILKEPEVETSVIDEINRLKPDVLIVGFGTPLQEEWITRCQERLDVSVIWPLGAVMDYFTGATQRCPKWMGDMGFEWLYRLMLEPGRMAGRYVKGNPWFLTRMFFSRMMHDYTYFRRVLAINLHRGRKAMLQG